MLTLYAIKNNKTGKYYKNSRRRFSTYKNIGDAKRIITYIVEDNRLNREDFSIIKLEEVGEVK
jgi:hypothetical protein